MSEHTPTPWKADIRTGCLAIYPASEDHNCLDGFSKRGIMFQGGFGEQPPESAYQLVTPLQEANAAFIVRACNAHEKLAEALKGMVREMNWLVSTGLIKRFDLTQDLADAALAALANAETVQPKEKP